MNKHLIALAALAAAGSALAQSNVTLYGRLNTSYGHEKNNLTNVGSAQMYSGDLTSSRWGLRGSEDLGNGLKANFQLEAGFNSSDGTGTAGFDRQSWVGLSGGFGAVKFGKTDSVFKDVYDLGLTHNVFDSDYTPVKIAYTGVANFSSRPNNQIRYETPNMSGFSAGVTYAVDEDATVSNDISAFSLRYKAGALDVGFGLQNQQNSTAASDRDFQVLSAVYDFGVVRVSGQFHNAKQANGVKDSDWAAGLSVPMGALDYTIGYARSTTKTNGATTAKGNAYGMGVMYTLSKRTRVYATYLTGDVKNAAGVKTADRTQYAVGIRHDF